MEKTIEGKVLAMEIVLTSQSEAIVKAIMASGYDDPALIIEEALRYFHEVKSTTLLDDAEELGASEALESLENFSLTDLSEQKRLKLYPYDEQARQEDEAAYQECLNIGGIPGEQVTAWLDSIGTNTELPCPIR